MFSRGLFAIPGYARSSASSSAIISALGSHPVFLSVDANYRIFSLQCLRRLVLLSRTFYELVLRYRAVDLARARALVCVRCPMVYPSAHGLLHSCPVGGTDCYLSWPYGHEMFYSRSHVVLRSLYADIQADWRERICDWCQGSLGDWADAPPDVWYDHRICKVCYDHSW